MKKMLMTMMAVIMLCCTCATVSHADTTYFTLTLTETGKNQDSMSKKTNKAGGSAYERKSYVTATFFSNPGKVLVKSKKYNTPSVCTGFMTLTDSDRRTVSSAYNQYPEQNKYYYLQGEYRNSVCNGKITVKGRYTP